MGKRERMVLKWSGFLLILSLIFLFTVWFWSEKIFKVKAEEIITSFTRLAPNDFNLDHKDIVVDNATLVVDGIHTFNSLTIKNNGQVTHSPADRQGKINRYPARGDYWGLKFEGFLRVPVNTARAIIFDSVKPVDDYGKIEMGVGTDFNDPRFMTIEKVWKDEST